MRAISSTWREYVATGRKAAGSSWDVLLAAIAVAVALAATLLPSIPQDPAYHHFADGRTLLGIPNARDVLSNAAFAVVGAAGLAAALRRGAVPDRRARAAWLVLFGAVALTSVGSALYHLAPSDDGLVWDRIPMAIGFMALVAVLAGERFGAAVGRHLLPRLVLLGVASVAWWYLGAVAGGGNLLPYLIVQFGAVAAIPALLARRDALPGPRAPWFAALALYVLAKVLEVRDPAVLAVLGVSGHTLKHLAAAAAIGVLAAELWRRGNVAGKGPAHRPAAAGLRSSMLEKSRGGT
jgi:hypothetical protein